MPSDTPSKVTSSTAGTDDATRSTNQAQLESREVRSHFGPTEMVILQGTTQCNINCRYCYLSEKSRRSRQVMTIANLRTIFDNLFSTGRFGRQLVICWHSGEPLMLPPSYYDEAIGAISDLRDHYIPELQLRFDVQTNAIPINEKWCEFFQRHAECFEIGVSCDGPAAIHDANRLSWSEEPTHEKVVRGIERLAGAGVQFNMIAVVANRSLDHADDIYDFAVRYIDSLSDFHFNLLDTPASQIVSIEGSAAAQSAASEYLIRYRRFLQRLLERTRQDVLEGRRPLPIRNFRHIYTRVLGSAEEQNELSMRSMARPMKTLSVEADGRTTAFYAGLTSSDYTSLYGDDCGLVVGNLLSDSVTTIAASPKLLAIATDFEVSHRACESGCDYASLCSGGFNLTKKVRFGTFEATETPECVAHVKTLVDEVLADLQRHADSVS
ncbi:radical SAM protein [uncultured Rubinisphaera sp.]|nr:hypothetical protein [Rubinisphaera sp.]